MSPTCLTDAVYAQIMETRHKPLDLIGISVTGSPFNISFGVDRLELSRDAIISYKHDAIVGVFPLFGVYAHFLLAPKTNVAKTNVGEGLALQSTAS